MFDLLAGLLGGELGGWWMGRRERRLPEQRRAAFARGEEVRIPCAVRYAGRTAWLHGELTLSATACYWTPPAMRTPRIDLDKARLEILGVRQVSGKESLEVNPSFAVMSCRIDGSELDLAMARSDLEMMGGPAPIR